MAQPFGVLRRFRFNRPQRVAFALLLCFLLQTLCLALRTPLSEADFQLARCGRESFEQPGALSGYYTSCGNLHNGILAYRLAGLPLSLALRGERALDHFRSPENRLFASNGAPASAWDLHRELGWLALLLRLPFMAIGCLLGGCLWWVTRRLFGNLGGYTALGLYCFNPTFVKAAATPGAELLAALGLYAGIYTLIGVSHAMQGPRRKWRPRIVLLAAVLTVAAATHLLALGLTLSLGLALMLWVSEGRRRLIPLVVALATLGAILGLFLCYGFSFDAASYAFEPSTLLLALSAYGLRQSLFVLPTAGLTLALAVGLLLYATTRRSRFFGNTAPLLCAMVLLPLTPASNSGAQPWLWAIPFLLTFIAGVFADAYESPSHKLAVAAGAAMVGLQMILGLLALVGL